jgi:hypothetical protein
MNGGLNPVLHLGRNTISFNASLSFTVRRDLDSPVALDQNLFRQSLYMQTSPLWNWLAIRGTGMHEAGPFTQQNLTSSDWYGTLEFQIGRPWGNTAMLTGYSVRDLNYNPLHQEWYQTSSYIGLQRKFGEKMTAAALWEYIRAWAVNGTLFGTGQAIVPAFRFNYQFNRRWDLNANFAWSSGRSFHSYDNMEGGFFISYQKPLRRSMNDGAGEVAVKYPLRFSFGFEQQAFYNYPGTGQVQWHPAFRLTLF